MQREVFVKIINEPRVYEYLKNNSYWYKYLNRNPDSFNDFIEEVKAAYKLRPQDKIDKIMNALDVLNIIMEMK